MVNDVQTDPRLDDGDRTKMLSRQMAAFVGTTLFKGGRMVAAFGVNHVAPRIWTASEIELVRDVGERTWDAVERTRAEAALREQRTAARVSRSRRRPAARGRAMAATNQRRLGRTASVALYGIPARRARRRPTRWMTARARRRPSAGARSCSTTCCTSRRRMRGTSRSGSRDQTELWRGSRAVGRVDRDAGRQRSRGSPGLDLDFTAHRQAEEAHQARRDEEHDRALRTLLETATQGIVSVDAQGVIVTANHAFEAMFGWASGDLIGQPIERLLPSAFRDAHAAPSDSTISVRRMPG